MSLFARICEIVCDLLYGRREKPVLKYSSEWFRTVSDAVLYREQVPINRMVAYGEYDPQLEELKDRFDREFIRRMGLEARKNHPNPKPYHKEHGYHLPEDDE